MARRPGGGPAGPGHRAAARRARGLRAGRQRLSSVGGVAGRRRFHDAADAAVTVAGGSARCSRLLLAHALVRGQALERATRSSGSCVIVPFDATALEREEQWMGEGVAEVLALGLAQHPAFVQIERCAAARRRAGRTPGASGGRAGGARRARRRGALRPPRASRDRPGRPAPAAGGQGERRRRREPRARDGARGRALRRASARCPSPTRARCKRHPDRRRGRAGWRRRRARRRVAAGLRAVRARPDRGDCGGGQEGNEAAVDLLSRAIEADPSFVVAQYTLGAVHQALGNRWKAAAQFRASTQLDADLSGAVQGPGRPVPGRSRAACSTRRSRRTARRSSCGRSTPTPTSGSATPRRPRATSTAPSPPTRRRSSTTRSTRACT